MDIIEDFLFHTLPDDQMPLVADMISKNETLKERYKEEKKKLTTYLYVEKELPPIEKRAFEKRMENDKVLVEEVRLRESLNISLECMELNNKLDRIYHDEIKEKPVIKMLPIHSKYTKWIAAAAITLLLTISGIAYHTANRGSLQDRLYAKYYTPYDLKDSYFMSDNFNYAKQKYMDGEYHNAFLLLSRIPQSIDINVERNFYMGLTLMEMGKYKDAVEYFSKVLSGQTLLDYTPQVTWYIGLCHLKLGNMDEAIDYFKEVADNTSNSNHKKAKQILKKLM